jgi:trk system potassium uptake protein TrkH
MPAPRPPLSPPRILALGVVAFIAAGTILLALPVSAAGVDRLPLLSAFFTATSAVCVTGLIVVDTPVAFSGFGEAVILVLIQIGGLGYMTLSTLVAIALGRRVGLHSQFSLQESLNLTSRRDLLKFTATVFKFTLGFELVAAAILAVHWSGQFGWGTAAWQGLFHAVSAFNNAGFSLFSTSLMDSRGDVLVNAVIAILIVAGGLGYLVLIEVARYRRARPLSMHSKLVLTMSAVLIVVGTLAILLLERGNAASLGQLPAPEAAMAALFQSVTARTAGFNTLDVGALRPATLFLMMILMFVGASPGGTGGGVKVSTFSVTVLALWATIRGYREPTVFGRRLPADLVARAFFVSLTAFLALNVAAGLLLVTEGGELLRTLFESTSAFGTVGLSTGLTGMPLSLTGGYSTAGQLVICALMFIGRVGPLTVAFALAGRVAAPRVRYPEGRVLIG